MTPELSILIKATIALAAGLAAAALAGHARASVRHLILVATLGALLALPLAGMLMPELTVAIQVPLPKGAVVFAPGLDVDGAAVPAVGPAAGSFAPQPDSWFRGISLAGALRLAWAGGAALLLGVLLHALWQVRQIRRNAIPWLTSQPAVDALALDAGISRGVSVVLHEAVPVPVTCGWRHPVIVMPGDARLWSDADLRRAFVHELEHVRRGDWPVQLGARVVCAAYWFHPLVWMICRRLFLECERACDDAVVSRMEQSDYAEQLVALAGRFAGDTAQPVLSMARRSDLSVRVRAVLDRSQLRGRAGASVVAATVAVAAALVLMLAPMRVQAKPAALAEAAAAAQDRRSDDVIAGRRTAGSRALGRALVEAASDDDVDGVIELLDAGADVNATVSGDGTALLIAAREGNRSLVKLLLERGADTDIGVSGDGSALIMAAREGHLDIVRTLLERGADVNLGVEGDGNPLIMAAREGHLAIVQLLLDRGALIDEVVSGDENALISASGSGALEVVRLLVGRGANVNARVWAEGGWPAGSGEWRTPLNQARRGQHTEVVRYLQSRGAIE